VEPPLRPVRPDGGQPLEGGREVCVDGGAGDGLEALDLAGGDDVAVRVWGLGFGWMDGWMNTAPETMKEVSKSQNP